MEVKPQIRFLKEMEKMVYDRNFARKFPDLQIYYIYRGIEKGNGIRYDITVVPPQMLAREFVKTKGHSHWGNFSELYHVLEGKAIFLMQKEKGKIVEDIYAIEAKRGDFIIVPPKYTHLTINPSKAELKLGNWISERCKNIYEPLEKMGGACYFYTKKGWIKNKNYKKVPKLRFKKPLKQKPESLEFLRG